MKDTYKILILSDLSKSADKTIKSAVALAKIMNAPEPYWSPIGEPVNF